MATRSRPLTLWLRTRLFQISVAYLLHIVRTLKSNGKGACILPHGVLFRGIAGHLQGGIPEADVEALRSYWDVCPSLKSSLMRPLRPGYLQLSTYNVQLKQAIYEHPEFSAFIADMNSHFSIWKRKSAASLSALKVGCQPKSIISALAEDLLTHYRVAGEKLKGKGKSETFNLRLSTLDAYAIYQHLMDYWAQTMQDDCYLIAADDWKAETARVIETDKKGKEKDKGWTCDLIPKPLIVARYCAEEQAEIDSLTTELEAVTARLAEMEEENGGEEGAFSELDKVNKANVSARIKELKVEGHCEEGALLYSNLKLDFFFSQDNWALSRPISAYSSLICFSCSTSRACSPLRSSSNSCAKSSRACLFHLWI